MASNSRTCVRVAPLPVLGVALLSCFLASLAYSQQAAHANGATEVVKRERAGPYELQVGISPGTPRVGNLHISLVMRDAEGGETITNATVMVTAKGPQGATGAGPLQAISSPQSPQFYDADVPLDMEGSWILTLDLEGELGPASLELPLEVTKGGEVSVAFVAAAAIAFLAISIWTWDRVRGRTQRRKTRNI